MAEKGPKKFSRFMRHFPTTGDTRKSMVHGCTIQSIRTLLSKVFSISSKILKKR